VLGYCSSLSGQDAFFGSTCCLNSRSLCGCYYQNGSWQECQLRSVPARTQEKILIENVGRPPPKRPHARVSCNKRFFIAPTTSIASRQFNSHCGRFLCPTRIVSFCSLVKLHALPFLPLSRFLLSGYFLLATIMLYRMQTTRRNVTNSSMHLMMMMMIRYYHYGTLDCSFQEQKQTRRAFPSTVGSFSYRHFFRRRIQHKNAMTTTTTIL
jgi:hypothetical protein